MNYKNTSNLHLFEAINNKIAEEARSAKSFMQNYGLIDNNKLKQDPVSRAPFKKTGVCSCLNVGESGWFNWRLHLLCLPEDSGKMEYADT